MRRLLIVVGLVLVAALGLATIAVTRPDEPARSSDRASFARHRERTHRRPLVPRTPREPREPEEDENTKKQSGSSEGGGVYVANKTERHRVSGSGSIAVTSGAVDEGTGGNDSHLVGSPRPRPRRR